MKQDRFLTGILIGIGVLVVIALAVFFTRQDTQSYIEEDTPEGVVRNYVIALQKQEMERAYRYLAEGENKPNQAVFNQALEQYQLREISTASLQVDNSVIDGETATVYLVIVRGQNEPFGTGFREQQNALLELQNGAWKIKMMPYPYWGFDWYNVPLKPEP